MNLINDICTNYTKNNFPFTFTASFCPISIGAVPKFDIIIGYLEAENVN